MKRQLGVSHSPARRRRHGEPLNQALNHQAAVTQLFAASPVAASAGGGGMHIDRAQRQHRAAEHQFAKWPNRRKRAQARPNCEKSWP